MNAKLEILLRAIKKKLIGESIKGITITRVDDVSVNDHKPLEWDESFIEKWTEVLVFASVRGTSIKDDDIEMECNYIMNEISLHIRFDDDNNLFDITDIDTKRVSIRKR